MPAHHDGNPCNTLEACLDRRLTACRIGELGQ